MCLSRYNKKAQVSITFTTTTHNCFIKLCTFSCKEGDLDQNLKQILPDDFKSYKPEDGERCFVLVSFGMEKLEAEEWDYNDLEYFICEKGEY